MSNSHSLRLAGLLALASSAGHAQAPGVGQPDVRRETPEACVAGGGTATAYPLLQHWLDAYKRAYPKRCISYNTIGTRGGLKLLAAGESDFAVADFVPPADASTVMIRVGMAAVAPIYNLPGVKGLRFSRETLLGAFTGEITQWDDERIRRDNPGVALPSLKILLYHDLPAARLRGGADTGVFLGFLVRVAQSVHKELPRDSWPVDTLKQIRSGGAPGFVRDNAGALSYAWFTPDARGVEYAAVGNDRGEFIEPTSATLSAASRGCLPLAMQVQATPADGSDAARYPISSPLTMLYDRGNENRSELRQFAEWILVDGQAEAEKAGEPPLARDCAKKELDALEKMG